jgi:hypothetical protein
MFRRFFGSRGLASKHLCEALGDRIAGYHVYM